LEKIYRKINLKKINDNINIKILLTQSFFNIGILHSTVKLDDSWETPIQLNGVLNTENNLIDKLLGLIPNQQLINFETPKIKQTKTIDDYLSQGGLITYVGESRLDELATRKSENKYIVGLELNVNKFINYNGVEVTGFNKITEINGGIYKYIIDNVFTYETNVNNDTTQINYLSQGWNKLNTSFEANYKEDYLLGYDNVGYINSDVFIDRGITSVYDYHLPLMEIDNLDKLIKYNDNFYKIKK